MPERDHYIPGVPCWVDTSQPDPEAGVAFYSSLFGWEFEDVMPPGSPGKYFVARLGGGDVAAVASQPQGAPPAARWNTKNRVGSAPQTPRRPTPPKKPTTPRPPPRPQHPPRVGTRRPQPNPPSPTDPDARIMISAPMFDSRRPRSCNTPCAKPTVKTISSTPTAVPRTLTAVRAGR